jgi:hypothetical protein
MAIKELLIDTTFAHLSFCQTMPLSLVWERLSDIRSTVLGVITQRICLTLCLLNRLGEYWFHISRYVYDCNRPLAPIIRQRQCSLMYDVYLICIDDNEQVLHVLLERDRNTWNTMKAKNQMKNKSRTTLNKSRTITT